MSLAFLMKEVQQTLIDQTSGEQNKERNMGALKAPVVPRANIRHIKLTVRKHV